MQKTVWIFLSLLIAIAVSAPLFSCAPPPERRVRWNPPEFDPPGPRNVDPGPAVKPTPGPYPMSCRREGNVDPAIFGGEAVSPESWLGRSLVTVIRLGRYQSVCTGTLIDRNIVLTAAHCVDSLMRPEFTIVGFTNDPLCDLNNDGMKSFRSAEKISANVEFFRGGQHDLALIRFEGVAPTGYGYLQLPGREMKLEPTTSVLLSGYGKDHDYNENSYDRLDLKFTHVAPFYGKTARKSAQPMTAPVLYFDQRQGRGACAGDSGGPALLKTPAGNFQVIGVGSRVDSLDDPEFEVQSDVTCSKGIVYTSTLNERAWIEATFASLRDAKSVRLTPYAEESVREF